MKLTFKLSISDFKHELAQHTTWPVHMLLSHQVRAHSQESTSLFHTHFHVPRDTRVTEPPTWQCWLCHGTMPWLGLCSLSSDFPILFWIIHTRFILVLAVPFPSWGGPSLCSGALWINSTGQQALLPFTTQRLGGRKRNSPDSAYRDVSNRAGQGGVQVRCLSIKYLGVCMSLFGNEGFISKWWVLWDVKRGKITFLDKS